MYRASTWTGWCAYRPTVSGTEKKEKIGNAGEAAAGTAAHVRPVGHGVPGRMDRESRRGDADPVLQLREPHKSLVFHSENGAIGYGPLAPPENADRHLVNAGGQQVTALPGLAIVHHADSFALIRKGMVDVTGMGAYEVAENGGLPHLRVPP